MFLRDVDDDRKLSPDERGCIGSRSPENRIVRRLQIGILVSLDEAENMADFIKNQITQFKKKREEK